MRRAGPPCRGLTEVDEITEQSRVVLPSALSFGGSDRLSRLTPSRKACIGDGLRSRTAESAEHG